MALRSISNLRSLIMGHLRGNARYATSTTQKAKAYAPTADYAHHHLEHHEAKLLPKPEAKGDYVPVYVALGMILLSGSLGLYTAMQQLMYSPSVRVRKRLRETVPEVYDPDRVLDEAGKFVDKSFFRKVAHVQEFDLAIPDPIRKDAYAHERHAVTLKSVGVDPNHV